MTLFGKRYFAEGQEANFKKEKRMKKTLALLLAAILIISGAAFLAGCSDDCEECRDCPDCPRENPTDTEGPIITLLETPHRVTIGQTANFAATAQSDTTIVSWNWALAPSSLPGENYYFAPSGSPTGSFTPTGTRPSLIVASDTLEDVTHSFDTRGAVKFVVEATDADGLKGTAGKIVYIDPTTPDDTTGRRVVRLGETAIWAADSFANTEFGMWASTNALGAVFSPSKGVFDDIAYAQSATGTEEHIYAWSQIGKKVEFENSPLSKDVYVSITPVFDIDGAMHLWAASADDYVRVSAYVLAKKTTDGSTHISYFYDKTFSATDIAYNLNSMPEALTILWFEGGAVYEVYFGFEYEIYVSDGAGASINFDTTRGGIAFQQMTVYLPSVD